MDLATIIGFIAGVVCIVYGMSWSGDMGMFFDINSILIVVGGSISASLISFSLKDLGNLASALKATFFTKKIDLNRDIDMIIDIANTARKEGLLALEGAAGNINDPFLRKGIMLMVDGSDPELVKSVLETELSYIESRHSVGVDYMFTLSSYAPAFGMVGTMIGLIPMLKQLEDPSALGPGMSVALITTFYGSIMSNLICTPLGKKMRVRTADEILRKELLMEGLLSIQDGENPRIIRDKLTSFISRKEASKGSGGRAETMEARG